MACLKLKSLLAATGLSSRQAGNLLGVSADSVKSWLTGRRSIPSSAIDGLCEYYEFMNRWAEGRSWPAPDITTDEEALREGFHSVASYRIATSKVFFSRHGEHRNPVLGAGRNHTLIKRGGDERPG